MPPFLGGNDYYLSIAFDIYHHKRYRFLQQNVKVETLFYNILQLKGNFTLRQRIVLPDGGTDR